MSIRPDPLVRLTDFSEELRAGFGSSALAVRTLDRVSLAIHPNELLVVQGGVASGAASLVAAVVGRRIGGAVMQRGARHIDPALQIRRGRIDRRALDALLRAWTECEIHRAPDPQRVLYVLRAHERPAAHASVHSPSMWRTWVAAIRKRGGSVLVHTTTAVDAIASADTHAPHAHMVRESAVRVDSLSASVYKRTPHSASLRLLRCEAGRVLSAAARRTADASPASSDPYPTGWLGS